MIWPYFPFDHERGERVPLLQIPPTLMDGGIFYHEVTPQEGLRQIRDHFREVFYVGGAVVLDWHLEQLNPARLRGAGPVLARMLGELAHDGDIFWASPLQLAKWWQERRRQITELVPVRHPVRRQASEAPALRPERPSIGPSERTSPAEDEQSRKA